MNNLYTFNEFLNENTVTSSFKLNEKQKALGDCYQANGKLAMDNEDYTLVHGIVGGTGPLRGKRYGHCWVEYKGRVFDQSNGNNHNFPKDMYYKAGKIKESDNVKYTSTEACVMMLKNKHWGPWHEDAIEVIDENIPTKSSEIGDPRMSISREDLKIIKDKIKTF